MCAEKRNNNSDSAASWISCAVRQQSTRSMGNTEMKLLLQTNTVIYRCCRQRCIPWKEIAKRRSRAEWIRKFTSRFRLGDNTLDPNGNRSTSPIIRALAIRRKKKQYFTKYHFANIIISGTRLFRQLSGKCLEPFLYGNVSWKLMRLAGEKNERKIRKSLF